jgi:hypothetical protein
VIGKASAQSFGQRLARHGKDKLRIRATRVSFPCLPQSILVHRKELPLRFVQFGPSFHHRAPAILPALKV